MSDHRGRMSWIGRFAPPLPGTYAAKSLEHWAAEMQKDPSFQKHIKKRFKHAVAIVTAQVDNGAGFPVDELIRYFLQEYNNRNFEHGLHSMPSSFNVMEAFFEYDAAHAIFKIRDETDHLLSFVEFLDYVTSPDCPDNIGQAIEYIDEDVIYSFNMSNDPGTITFSTDDNCEYGIGGVSLIRHGSEVIVLLLAGEKADLTKKTEEISQMKSQGNVPGRESIRPAEDRKREAVPLLGDDRFWQVVVLTRMDFDEMTQSVRYLLRDAGNSFVILTDDTHSFVKHTGEFISASLEETAKRQAVQIESYSAIFEICKTALYLPIYFDQFGELIEEERHSTKLFENRRKPRSLIRNKFISARERINFRRVSVLHRAIGRQPDFAAFKAPGFKIDTSGFWRKLPTGNVGADKRGRPIHGRTWVKKTLTWLEPDEDPSALRVKTHYPKSGADDEPSTDSKMGYIYVMRSAAHDKDIFKIGRTKRSAEIRSEELSRTTGVPDKFLVVQEWEVSDCVKAEAMIHARLSQYRLSPQREFFKAPYKEVFRVVDEIIGELQGD